MSVKPKILIWDIETTNMDVLVKTYQLKNYTSYFSYKDIVRDWSILGAAWKWLDDPITSVVSVKGSDVFNDRQIVQMLHDVISSADILVGHNVDKFDIKKFNARAMLLGFPPIEKKRTIDTLKEVKKVGAFSSNTLGYLAKAFGITPKMSSPDWNLVMSGDDTALREMREYNKQDVITTEALYLKIRPYMDNHIDLNIIADIRDTDGNAVKVCTACLSANISKRGFQFRARKKVQSYSCGDCGKRFT